MELECCRIKAVLTSRLTQTYSIWYKAAQMVEGCATFSEEQKRGLSERGYRHFYLLTGKTIAELRREDKQFKVEPTNDTELIKRKSMRIEVALHSKTRLLPNSNFKMFADQTVMITALNSRISEMKLGVKAVIGNPTDYLELILAHRKTVKELLFRNNNYVYTVIETNNDRIIVVGFNRNEPCVTDLSNDERYEFLWTLPLIVPETVSNG